MYSLLGIPLKFTRSVSSKLDETKIHSLFVKANPSVIQHLKYLLVLSRELFLEYFPEKGEAIASRFEIAYRRNRSKRSIHGAATLSGSPARKKRLLCICQRVSSKSIADDMIRCANKKVSIFSMKYRNSSEGISCT